MKTKYFIGIAVILGSSFLLQSCLDDDKYENNLYPNALVTVKQANNKTVFLQLDDKTTLYPVNIKTVPFGGKEVRALINCKEVNQPSEGYTKAVHVNWMDSIRTKMMVPNLGTKNDSIYGKDPVEIIQDWVTIAEDGYLTLRFRTIWGNQTIAHHVNLLPSNNPDNLYEVEFRHNAFKDTVGVVRDALVAFKLDMLPNTKGETVKLKLKWQSFKGPKSVEFNYNTGKATPSKAKAAYSRNMVNVQ